MPSKPVLAALSGTVRNPQRLGQVARFRGPPTNRPPFLAPGFATTSANAIFCHRTPGGIHPCRRSASPRASPSIMEDSPHHERIPLQVSTTFVWNILIGLHLKGWAILAHFLGHRFALLPSRHLLRGCRPSPSARFAVVEFPRLFPVLLYRHLLFPVLFSFAMFCFAWISVRLRGRNRTE